MKKLSAIILAVLMALTLSVSVFAEEAEPVAKAYADNEVLLIVGNSANWTNTYSEPVAITGSGTYTFLVDGLDFAAENITVVYLKDGNVEIGAVTESCLPDGITITSASIKVNGEERVLTDGYMTTKNETNVFDICTYNIWATNYFDLDGLFDINSFEFTITVEVPEVTEAPAEDEAPAEEEAPADEPADEPETEAEPEVEAEDEPAETGLALSLIPAAIAMAVVALKRR